MPTYKRKTDTPIDAEQFLHTATAPRGVRTEEDGRAYVMTLHNQKAYIVPGDWIVKEPGNNDCYYPIKDIVFQNTYELVL